jgi:hypothetical protein
MSVAIKSDGALGNDEMTADRAVVSEADLFYVWMSIAQSLFLMTCRCWCRSPFYADMSAAIEADRILGCRTMQWRCHSPAWPFLVLSVPTAVRYRHCRDHVDCV